MSRAVQGKLIFGGCAAVSLALHAAAFGFGAVEGSAMSSGEGGEALVSVEAGNATLTSMIEAFDSPQLPDQALDLPQSPPQIDLPAPAVPIEALPPMPDLAVLQSAPTIPQVATIKPPPKPARKVTPPKATPKRVAQPPAPKASAPSRVQQAGAQEQRAAGSGGGASAGAGGAAQAATVSKAQQNDLRASWGASIRARIERRKRYPSAAGRASGRAVVRLTVTSSGALAGVSLAQSSGNAALDAAALESVQRAGNFPAAPKGLGGGSFSFSLPISFAR
ncbi:TonB family protein [Albirhodobacter sp. R86504]|uniref:TonB family protein n=1 Tax=Albirhodobacter sp. R86504 TaxID=3093848 RepID=UPI00366E3B9C